LSAKTNRAPDLRSLGTLMRAVGSTQLASAPTCPYCTSTAVLVGGATIYPRSPQLEKLKFWHCAACAAWVGCHAPGNGQGDGTSPLGRLANAELRAAKHAAHAAFDPLWKMERMSRYSAYAWLAERLGIHPKECHIGMMDVGDCKRVVEAVSQQRLSSPRQGA
jgi:hypothetical protein